MSLDPLQMRYPFESNYSYTANNPIFYVDEEGKKKTVYLKIIDEQSGSVTTLKVSEERGLMMQKNIHTSSVPTLFGGTYTSKTVDYSWYDINQVNTLTYKKDGTVVYEIGKETRGQLRTNTNSNSKTWANIKTGDLLKYEEKEQDQAGGDVLTSSDGAGADNKYAPGAKHIGFITNIDKLVSLTGFPSFDGFDFSKTTDRLEFLLALSDNLEKVSSSLSSDENAKNAASKMKEQTFGKQKVYDKATKTTWEDSLGFLKVSNKKATDTVDTDGDYDAGAGRIYNKLNQK